MADPCSVMKREPARARDFSPRAVPGASRAEGRAAARAVLAVLVQDKAGVLCRVAELFSRRGYNIDSLTVGVTSTPGLSRMTIVTRGDEDDIEQIRRQLEKLVEVVSVRRLAVDGGIFRELALIKIAASPELRAEILEIASEFEARVVDDAPGAMTLEATRDKDGIDDLIERLRPFGLVELARTGVSALERGSACLSIL